VVNGLSIYPKKRRVAWRVYGIAEMALLLDLPNPRSGRALLGSLGEGEIWLTVENMSSRHDEFFG